MRTWPDRVPPENRTLGWHVLSWTAEWLLQPDGPDVGNTWTYTREQVRILLRWYEIDARGAFVHRRGALRRMKGWGKDPFLASLSAVELCGPCRFAGWDEHGMPLAKPQPSAWIQVAAVSKDQTRNTLTVFPHLFSGECIEEYGVEIGRELIHTRAGGRIEAVTSSPRTLEGGRPTFVILNETQNWLPTNDGIEMGRAIRRNAAKSRGGESRSMEINNAFQPGEGSVAENTYLAFKAGAEGLYYDSLEAPPVADLTDEQAVKAAIVLARGDATWVSPERLWQEISDPTTPESVTLRYYLNQVAEAEETWADIAKWRACETDDRIEPGDTICLGFDGSIREDSTALVACRVSDGLLQPLKVWEKPSGPRGFSWQVPRQEVDDAVRDAFADYRVVLLYADPPHWENYVDAWAAEYGEKVVLEFWTMSAKRMASALERFHTAMLSTELLHTGDETLTAHVGNAVAVTRNGGLVQIAKRTNSQKIDALVSAVLAYEARGDAVKRGLATVRPTPQFYSF